MQIVIDRDDNLSGTVIDSEADVSYVQWISNNMLQHFISIKPDQY